MALLLEVIKALSDPDIPPPELVATNEATVATVFKTIQTNLTLKCDGVTDPNDP